MDTPAPMQREYLSTKETASFLGVSVFAIKAWRKRGKFIQGYQFGTLRALRYKKTELEAWATSKRETPPKRAKMGLRLPCGKEGSI